MQNISLHSVEREQQKAKSVGVITATTSALSNSYYISQLEDTNSSSIMGWKIYNDIAIVRCAQMCWKAVAVSGSLISTKFERSFDLMPELNTYLNFSLFGTGFMMTVLCFG